MGLYQLTKQPKAGLKSHPITWTLRTV